MASRIPPPDHDLRVVTGSDAIDEAASVRAVTALDGGGELEVWSGTKRLGWVCATYGACSGGGHHPTITWYLC